MSFNNKKDDFKDQLEIDDMNIKSHLNASLDLEGINVSEELINRTLEAIKKQQNEQPEQMPIEEGLSKDDKLVKEKELRKEDTKKVIPWNKYIRRIAGAAAAILIIAAGYNVINHSNVKYDSMEQSTDSSAPEDASGTDGSVMYDQADKAELKSSQSTADSASNELADAELNGVAGAATDSEAATETAPQFTITADTFAAENTEEEAAKEDGSSASSSDTSAADQAGDTDAGVSNSKAAPITVITGVPSDVRVKSSAAVTGSAGAEAETQQRFAIAATNSTVLTFRDIFLPDPKQAEYIKITNDLDNTEITLTDAEDIEAFYSMMDQHQFSDSTASAAGQDYTVEVKTPEPGVTSYTMVIGEYITVDSNDGQMVSQSIYLAADAALLKANLDEFFQKYYK